MTAIAVIGYNRPEYFNWCMASLVKCPEVWDLPVYFFLDGGPLSCQEDYVAIINKYATARNYWEIIQTKYNLGIGQHLLYARDKLFFEEKHDSILVIEDDVVSAPSLVNISVKLNNWCQQRASNVGAVSVWSLNKMSRRDKAQRLKDVHISNVNWITYLMTKKCWAAIRPHVVEYVEQFLKGRPYKQRDAQGIREWARGKMNKASIPHAKQPFPRVKSTFNPHALFDGPRFPTSQDGMVVLGMALENFVKVSTIVNRCLYIGKEGEHGTSDLFRNHGFEQVKLDIFPEDFNINEFTVYIK